MFVFQKKWDDLNFDRHKLRGVLVEAGGGINEGPLLEAQISVYGKYSAQTILSHTLLLRLRT